MVTLLIIGNSPISFKRCREDNPCFTDSSQQVSTSKKHYFQRSLQKNSHNINNKYFLPVYEYPPIHLSTYSLPALGLHHKGSRCFKSQDRLFCINPANVSQLWVCTPFVASSGLPGSKLPVHMHEFERSDMKIRSTTSKLHSISSNAIFCS